MLELNGLPPPQIHLMYSGVPLKTDSSGEESEGEELRKLGCLARCCELYAMESHTDVLVRDPRAIASS